LSRKNATTQCRPPFFAASGNRLDSNILTFNKCHGYGWGSRVSICLCTVCSIYLERAWQFPPTCSDPCHLRILLPIQTCARTIRAISRLISHRDDSLSLSHNRCSLLGRTMRTLAHLSFSAVDITHSFPVTERNLYGLTSNFFTGRFDDRRRSHT
jgi:hypothetical protein